MDKKVLRNDIILISVLALLTIIALVLVNGFSSKKNLVAKVYVQNEIVETIDIDKSEGKEYVIKGLKGDVHILVKDGAIAVIESNCPYQDCVRTGYVKETNHPIICAYNAVYIVIEGTSNYDTEIG